MPIRRCELGLVAALAGCTGADDGGTGAAALPYAFVRVAGPLHAPTDVVALPDGSVLVASLDGALTHLDPETGHELGATVVPGVVTGGEQGLLALEVDPLFGDGAHDALYTWRTVRAEDANALSRWALSLDPLEVTDEDVLVEVVKPTAVHAHNGGDLAWWSTDGGAAVLAVSVGDGDPTRSTTVSQDAGALPGKVLTVDVRADDPAAEVLALGLRNPWRMARCGSALCVADVGLDTWEEIDVVASPGANLGWPLHEGPTGAEGFVDPIVAWDHESTAWCHEDALGCEDLAGAGSRSAWVGPRASEAGYGGALDGVVLFGDLYTGSVRGVPVDEVGAPTGADVPLAHLGLVGAMTETASGELVAVELLGTVQRLVPAASAPSLGAPGTPLSSTSYASPGLEYTPRHPLWSNGAVKARKLQLPDGQRPAWSTDGPVFPEGTRAFKTFSVGGVPVETRLLEKQAGGWAAGVFVWDGDDAYLTDGRAVTVDTVMGPYDVPSAAECEACHASRADRLLAVDAVQLDAETLAALGGGAARAPYADPVQEAARGWLHGNCAHCHHDGGAMGVALDLRYDADGVGHREVISTRLYPGAALIARGAPDDSALVWAIEDVEMPPIGVWEPDVDGLEAVRAWIEVMAP